MPRVPRQRVRDHRYPRRFAGLPAVARRRLEDLEGPFNLLVQIYIWNTTITQREIPVLLDHMPAQVHARLYELMQEDALGGLWNRHGRWIPADECNLLALGSS